MEMFMSDRLPCCVPYCNHTHANTDEFSEWICAAHWRLTDKKLRHIRSIRLRRWRRFWDMQDWKKAHRQWLVLKKQAIERAAGI